MDRYVRPETTLTGRIREHARAAYIEPALKRGADVVSIIAGDIVNDLHLVNRTPAVCSALRSRTFLRENHLAIEKDEGPPKGMSTTVKITYRLGGAGKPPRDPRADFEAMRGILKDTYAQLGGGEAFLNAEREAWGD